jgi:hypothetical protein
LISDDLLSGQLSYIPNSYQSFGQDGNHFNLSYNNITNDVVPPYINDALYNMSDHLPVIMELKYDHKVSSIKGSTKNNVPKLLAIKDILGRNVDPNNNGLQFHIYDNGIVEKKLVDN